MQVLEELQAIPEMARDEEISAYMLTGAAFLSFIVPMLVFFALQRYFVRGLLAGSMKG